MNHPPGLTSLLDYPYLALQQAWWRMEMRRCGGCSSLGLDVDIMGGDTTMQVIMYGKL